MSWYSVPLIPYIVLLLLGISLSGADSFEVLRNFNGGISSTGVAANSVGTISGHVFEADGTTPIYHIAIRAEDLNNTFEETVCTNASGSFQLNTVPLDKPVRLRADSYPGAAWCNASTEYLTEYWGETTPYGGPGLITLTNSEPVKSNTDFLIDPQGSGPVPNIDAWYLDGIVEALDWPLNTHIKLVLEDPATVLSPDHTLETDVTEITNWGPTYAAFDLNGLSQLDPGMIVSVSGNYTTKIITIQPIAVTEINLELNTISGTAPSNYWLWMFFDPSCCRSTVANSSGNWSFDYSVIGSNGEPIADVGYQSEGSVHIPSGNGGKTSVYWSAGSASGEVDSGGGVVSTPNSDTSIEIPAGAISSPTNFTVTDEGGGFTISTDQGNLQTVLTKTIGPEGTSFLVPITITLQWQDETNDGIVDDTTLNESDLYVSKNGILIAGPCNVDPGCDPTNNTFSIQVSSLSYFALGTTSNHAPAVNATTFYVRDPTSDGTSVGIVSYNDEDSSQNHICSIREGNIDNAFSIDPDTCEIAVNDASVIDSNILPSYSLKIRVTDNGTPTRFGEATITVNIDGVLPTVSSITRADASPTPASLVHFTVTFSEMVTNLNPNGSNFTLVTSSGVSGATITGVTPVSSSVYTVSANTGSGSGTIRLVVPENASITDLAGNPLSSLPFTSGEIYVKTILYSMTSIGASDGWILESTETSNAGGSMNSSATTLILGDDPQDRQYRAFLHFDTSALPDTAVITSAVLQLRRQGTTGTSPFTILGNLRVDARKPSFGSLALDLLDFRTTAGKNLVAIFSPTPTSNWYSAALSAVGRDYINRTGSTQFKIYFTKDDNDDLGADFMSFFSGNAGVATRPKLVIQYYVP